MPKELEEEIVPEFWDEPIFHTFFEMYQRGKEFYQTIFYYQSVMEIEFDGEDLKLLFAMWGTADKYYSDKENKKKTKKDTTPKTPKSKQMK